MIHYDRNGFISGTTTIHRDGKAQTGTLWYLLYALVAIGAIAYICKMLG